MKDAMLYLSVFLALAFILMGLYLRFKFKDKLVELDK